MRTEEQYDLLFDGVNALLDVSEKNEEDLQKLLVDITKTSALLEHTSTQIHKKLKQEVVAATNQMTKDIVNDVTQDLQEANKAAKEAASQYRQAVRTSVLKLYGLFALFSVFVAAIVWYIFIKDIPTISKINELREIQFSLEQDVNQLKSYGNTITYEGNIYIEVNKNQCRILKGETPPKNQAFCKIIKR
ncbi:hypothetical protein CKO50_12155 [Pseudoalteromonas sp. HM-SA03]|uniref:hypothetical protein n=1 Tax=Pseudoalteromonas sp. HM-SA03 TaxID=2029678 RepID=UPI000BADDA06|nr:hypothetical protein [Pseudoalteromonas sp. HM-SA03]PAY01043.1 hypothetical protein CKO50_12155 [Pseudoalteromonas sp. HM-SA03]